MRRNIEKLLPFLMIFIGSLLYGAGVCLFFDANELAPGGVSGISVMLSKSVDVLGVGAWSFLLNVPILLIGWWRFGRKFILSTFFAVAVSSVFMDALARLGITVTEDVMLSAIFGALLSGVGLGLVLRGGATTGGSDVLVRLLRTKLRHISSGTLFLIFDCVVIATSAVVFGNINSALYAGVASFLQARVINAVLYGGDSARLVYIISDNKQSITSRLLSELETGVTHLNGKGAYTDKDKSVLMCAVYARTLPAVKDIVREEDENAFMIVTSAASVFGEGYKQNVNEEI